jgi:Domain of unknown function (DUF222)
MSDAASTPDPAAAGDAGGPSRPGLWPGEGRPCLSEDDLLAVLDGLGVPGTHDPEEDQEAIAEAEWQARQAADSGAGGEDRSDDHGRAVSPVLIGEHLPAGPGLAAVLAQDPAGQATDWDLPGLAAAYRRLAAWAQARELDAAAEIAARRAAANPRIGTSEDGRPVSLPAEAAAEIALELAMTQPGASAWTVLGCRLRWDLPVTGAALAAGTIDLPRARIIAEATAFLSGEHAALVEQRVVPAAGGQTTSQLRAAARRAVLAIDPEGAEQRRRDTERCAKLALYPGEEGTATLTGSCLPGLQAAAAMARITAIARALKTSGAHGGLDLLRAHVYLGLLLGTLPYIPPPPGAPPDPGNPPPGNLPGGAPGEGGPGRSDADDPAGLSSHDSPPGGPDKGGTPGDGPAGNGGPATGASGTPADRDSASPDRPDTSVGPAPDGCRPAPADSDPPGHREAPGDGSELPGGEVIPRGREDPADLGDLPGWWPDIPPPTDADAPPGDGDRLDPVPVPAPDPDDADDDWPQLPPPHWPPLHAHLPAPPGAPPGPARAGDHGGPSAASALARTGLLDVLIPWTTLTGHSREPAILGRIGPVSSWQARELLALATRSPSTQWRVILTTDDGRAIGVHHAHPTRHPPPPRHNRGPDTGPTGPDGTGMIGRVTITIRASTLSTLAAQPRPDSPLTIQHLAPDILAAAHQAAAQAAERTLADHGAGGCAHVMASGSYRPPPRLREHITARDRTCRFGPCGQPAWRTDLDHTVPWHQGGPTCRCNLGSCCRTHHQIKALPGWHLHQPYPGTFTWTTPTGRTYHTQPDPYPV